jgi:hypothetical protein
VVNRKHLQSWDLQDPRSSDFDMFHNRLIPALQEGRHTIYSIIHSLKRAAIATFPNSFVRKGELECCDCDGTRKLTLVDAKAILDVVFGVPNIGGHAMVFLFLAVQGIW